MNPCIISKLPLETTNRLPPIRVGVQQYLKILNISRETGRSITDVSNRLLDFALANVQVTEEDRPT